MKENHPLCAETLYHWLSNPYQYALTRMNDRDFTNVYLSDTISNFSTAFLIECDQQFLLQNGNETKKLAENTLGSIALCLFG